MGDKINYQVLSSVLKESKENLIFSGITFTSIIFTGVGLFSKLGKTGFALGITGFISFAAFSLLFMAFTVLKASYEIKEDYKISREGISFIAMITIPLVLGTMLTGIGLFGNKLDNNVRLITGIVGFAALSFYMIYSTIDNVKGIKREYELELKNANYENGVKDQKLHAI